MVIVLGPPHQETCQQNLPESGCDYRFYSPDSFYYLSCAISLLGLEGSGPDLPDPAAKPAKSAMAEFYGVEGDGYGPMGGPG